MFMRLLFLCLPMFLFSNQFEETLQNELQWLEEETFVVSASRVKESVKKTPASVTIIDEDMIKTSGARTFVDLLNRVSGINVSQTYIYAHKIGVRGIQGKFSEKVLILLDGHSLNVDLLNGGALGAYEQFPIELIKRIEVVKGPASALYGENAFTALINIITKKADDINGSIVTVKAGKNSTSRVNFVHGEQYDDYKIVTSLDYLKSDGDSVYVSEDADGNRGNTNPYIKDMNAYFSLLHETTGFYLTANYNSVENGPNYGASNALNDEDLSNRESILFEMGLKKKLQKELFLHSRIYYDFYGIENLWEIHSEGYTNATPTTYPDGMLAYSFYDSKKYGLETLLTFDKIDYKIVSGVSFELQSLENPKYLANYHPISGTPLTSVQDFTDPSTNFISEEKRKFGAVYSEILYDISKDIRANFGIRYDYYDDFGGVTNPRLGLTWALIEEHSVKIMYGEAFRAPTFAELYNKNNPTILGNKDLKPEKIKTYELSYENSSFKDVLISTTLFNSNIDDIITLRSGQYQNNGKIQSRGIESEVKYEFQRGSYIFANYSYQKSKNKQDNQKLGNIPTHMAYIGINYRVNRYFNLYSDVKYLSHQTRDATSSKDEVDESYISNMTILAKNLIYKNTNLKLSIYNLFDETAYDSGSTIDYPMANRSYMFELSYKF